MISTYRLLTLFFINATHTHTHRFVGSHWEFCLCSCWCSPDVPLPISSLTATILWNIERTTERDQDYLQVHAKTSGCRTTSNLLINFFRPQSSHLYNRYNEPFASPGVIMGFWWSHTADCPAYISKSSVHTHPIITLLEGYTQKWLPPGSFLPPPQGPFKNWTPNFYHDAECYTFLCACKELSRAPSFVTREYQV